MGGSYKSLSQSSRVILVSLQKILLINRILARLQGRECYVRKFYLSPVGCKVLLHSKKVHVEQVFPVIEEVDSQNPLKGQHWPHVLGSLHSVSTEHW